MGTQWKPPTCFFPNSRIKMPEPNKTTDEKESYRYLRLVSKLTDQNYRYLKFKIVEHEDSHHISGKDFMLSFIQMMKKMFGEMGGACSVDLLKYCQGTKEGILRCPADFYVKIRSCMFFITAIRDTPVTVTTLQLTAMSPPERAPDNKSSEDITTWNTVPLQTHAIRNYMRETIDIIDQNGNTPLHMLAAYKGVPTPVFVYAECGVPINHINNAGDTALHLAVRENNKPIVIALLQCGADAELRNSFGITAVSAAPQSLLHDITRFIPSLHKSLLTGSFSHVSKLLKNWVSVTSEVDTGVNTFQLAKSLRENSNKYISNCCQKILDHAKQSMLTHAVLADNTELVTTLFQQTRMRSANSRFNMGKTTLLSIAIENKNTDIMRVLLENGVRTDCRVKHRLSQEEDDIIPCILMAFSFTPSIEVVELLLEYGVSSLHYRDQEELTAVEVAQKLGREDIIKYINEFIEDNIDSLGPGLMAQFYGELHPSLSRKCKTYESEAGRLFDAGTTGDLQLVIKHNQMNYQDRKGQTVLHKAIQATRVNVIKEITQSRPVLKGIPDNHGRYPLHYAYMVKDEDLRRQILACLLLSNADCYEFASDKNGCKPADYLKISDEFADAEDNDSLCQT